MATFAEGLAAREKTEIPYEPDSHYGYAAAEFKALMAGRIASGRRRGQPMTVGVHYVDDDGFNAFAVAPDDGDAIAINRDTFPMLLTICRSLVSHEHILPSHRTPGLIVDRYRCPVPSVEFITSQRQLLAPSLADPLRETLANKLFRICVQFIFVHEFAHIYLGHCELYEKITGVPWLMEMGRPRLASQYGYLFEMLEWQADGIAAQEIVYWVLQPDSDRSGGGFPIWTLPERNWIGSIDEGMQVLSMAVAICTRIMSIGDPSDPMDPTPRSHPHPALRFFYLLRNVQYIVARFTRGRMMTQLKRVGPSMQQLAEAWNATFKDAEPFRVDFAGLRATEESRQAIWERTWTEYHSVLKGYCRNPATFPPAEVEQPPEFMYGDAE